jgi:hypothetical protein
MQRSTRRLVPLLATGLLLAGLAAAQDFDKLAGSTPKQRADVQTAFMKQSLGLTDAAAAKVAAINLEYANQMQPILTGSEGSMQKLGAARRVEQAKDAELQNALTREQFQQYQAAKQEMREDLEQKLVQKSGGGASAP